MKNRSATSHSADVRISLAVNGHVFSVARLESDSLVLRDPVDHPPAEAEITMSIDDHRRQWRVALVDGIVAAREETRIARLPGPTSD